MKKYFLYELKKNAFAIGCLTLISVAVYATTVLTSPYLLRGATETYVWLISIIGGVLVAFVPAWMLNYKMKKRSVDLYYSLPLSHVKILTVRFLIGLIAVYVPYTAAYWLGAFAAMARTFSEMEAVFYIPQYFATLIPVYLIYAISSFVFTRANNILDGLTFILFWTFAAALVALVLEQLTAVTVVTGYDEYSGTVLHRTNYFVKPALYFPFSLLDFITGHFEMHIAGYMNIHAYPYETVDLVNGVIGFTITVLMAAGATAGLFFSERRAKAENAGQISESWFGYKTMIPLYTVCLEAVCSSYILVVIIAVCAFFLTVAYKRTFKIGKVQAIVLPASVIAGIILGVIIQFI